MEKTDMECPYCGYLNRNLYLDETQGFMECISCGKVSRDFVPVVVKKLPVLTPQRVRELAKTAPTAWDLYRTGKAAPVLASES